MNLPTYIAGNTQTKAYRLLREHVYDVLSKYELTPTLWSMLGIIAESPNGIRQIEVAHRLHVKAPLVTTMSRNLQQRQIIQSVQNQFDARAKLLALTPSGKKFLKTVEVMLQARLEKLLAGLTEAEMMIYQKVLMTIISNDAAMRRQK